jgi:phage terminase large subunit-like protein
LILITRLAQIATYTQNGEIKQLSLKMLLDENPPLRGHWTHKLFIEHKDPQSKAPLASPEDYAALLMNPADNAENLPESYLRRLEALPKRQRDRFWLGKFGDENENALWTDSIIDSSRINGIPEGVSIVRSVVAVDPSGADDDENKNNDDIGIGVAYLGSDGIGYVMEDLTINAGPAKWGKIAAAAYERHKADRVIGELNFGGAMVEFVVRAGAEALARESGGSGEISYKSVTASRGKVIRAEPISALHETGKIKLVGRFDELEDELKSFTTTGYTGDRSPNRADWFIWALTELFPGIANPEPEFVNTPIPKPKRGFN